MMMLAGVGLALAAGALTVATARPCTGSIHEVGNVTQEQAEAYPTIAGGYVVHGEGHASGFPLDEMTYVSGKGGIGGYRLRSEYETYRGRPAAVSFELDDPSSCNAGTVSFTTGMYFDSWSLQLARAPDGQTFVVRWTESGARRETHWAAFHASPPGPLRRLRRHLVGWLGIFAGAGMFLRGEQASQRGGGGAWWRFALAALPAALILFQLLLAWLHQAA